MRGCLRLMMFIGLLAVLAPVAYACECVPRRGPRAEMKVSRVVFVGTVVEANAGGRDGSYRFRVERIWKGSAGEFITVSGAYGTCSRLFTVGEKYLVYALEGRGELQSDTCMRTAPVSDAAKDLKALGRGRAVRKVSDNRVAPRPNNVAHPTADTTALMYSNRSGRRVIGGVRWLTSGMRA